jgi:hypothetical protein
LIRRLFAIILVPIGLSAACPQTHKLAQGDSFSYLASFYYADPSYATAILQATNTRTSEGFPFISNPDHGAPGQSVCIPDLAEAQRLRARYATYSQAVAETVTPNATNTSTKLVTFPGDREQTFATWIRANQAAQYTNKAPQDVWVTVEPNLQNFCRQFSRDHDGDSDQLTLRLEQRLGLPPGNGKTTFLRIRLPQPAKTGIFRPCSDPSTTAANCQAKPPDEKTNPSHAAWIYRQYYLSFAVPSPSLYPWTALGYTFDWAPAAATQFERVGESEFVIPGGAPIEVLGTASTADYCK